VSSTRFDVEVWNELSFGSDFLDSDTYYTPTIDEAAGDTISAILDRTVAWLRDPKRGLGKMGIGDGFASQTPFAAGSTSPPGLTAIDKHPYSSPRRFPEDAIFDRVVPLNARGRPDGILDQDEFRDRFVPRYTSFFPEYPLTAIQTESLVRDLAPFATRVYDTPHGRNTHPHGGSPPSIWITEWNLDPGDAGFGPRDGSLTLAQRRIQAKAVLRALVAFVNKGVTALYVFAAKDERLGIVAPDFFRTRKPKDAGVTIAAIARLLARFHGPAKLSHRHPFSLLAVGDRANRTQFLGDGTPVHPPLFDRDVVTVLPFQTSETKFVIAAYVMTRNVVASYPPTVYRLVLSATNACRSRFVATDPLTGKNVPVLMRSCGHQGLTLDVPLTDSPRLVSIEFGGGRNGG
jgi:hypothetical protein